MQNQDQQLKNKGEFFNLADALSQLVLREHQMLQQEISQVGSLVEDAVSSLDDDFRLLNASITEQKDALDYVVSNGLMSSETHMHLTKCNNELKLHTSSTIRALQFDDIVQQLTSHASERISQMQALFGVLDNKFERLKSLTDNDSETVARLIEGMREEIDRFRLSLEKENPVKQRTMKTGSIELF